MFKVQSIVFLGFLCIFCLNLKSKTQGWNGMCSGYQDDCDALFPTRYCCGEWKCIDYRCQEEGAKEVLPWAPKGIKCDALHRCPDHFDCMSHRCHPTPGEEAKALLTKLQG